MPLICLRCSTWPRDNLVPLRQLAVLLLHAEHYHHPLLRHVQGIYGRCWSSPVTPIHCNLFTTIARCPTLRLPQPNYSQTYQFSSSSLASQRSPNGLCHCRIAT